VTPAGIHGAQQEEQPCALPALAEYVSMVRMRACSLPGASGAYAAVARLARSMPMTFRRRCSALNAKVFVSSIV
jgi:hypothetical protein